MRVPRAGRTCDIDSESWTKGGISDNFAVLAMSTRPMQQPVSSRLRKGLPKSLPQVNAKRCISAVASATRKQVTLGKAVQVKKECETGHRQRREDDEELPSTLNVLKTSGAGKVQIGSVASHPTETASTSYKCLCTVSAASLRQVLRYEEKTDSNGPTHSVQPFIDIYDTSPACNSKPIGLGILYSHGRHIQAHIDTFTRNMPWVGVEHDVDEWEGGETREIRHQSGTLACTDGVSESGRWD
ncbi:hypothetical protein EDD85DRAFT_792455 [Armillaria nabsnona]|nr:hypothetical protein EDD85DRAFT_792455 [Armillaria nabsnona]